MPNNPVFTPVDNNGNVIGAAGSPSSVTISGTPTVTVAAPAPVGLFSESPQSRTSNSSTSTQTWTNDVTSAIVGVNVTTFTGGTNVVIGLQQQDANGIWQTLASSSTITGVGTATFSVGPGMGTGTVLIAGGSYRLTWTLTGTFSALSFQLSVQGR
ncbi:hypothetical protein ABZX95_17090 [Streptomyces sp. NPDC004232]|uniref:hypothetical protein n=1 Tax=Streptomyces sp. NPDC004232 TaxID=3154454 RepID=UPI0033BF4F0E